MKGASHSPLDSNRQVHLSLSKALGVTPLKVRLVLMLSPRNERRVPTPVGVDKGRNKLGLKRFRHSIMMLIT